MEKRQQAAALQSGGSRRKSTRIDTIRVPVLKSRPYWRHFMFISRRALGFALLIALLGCQSATQPADVVSTPTATASAPGAVHPEIWPAIQSPVPRSPEIETAVEDILRRMTLEEKAGQVIQASITSAT